MTQEIKAFEKTIFQKSAANQCHLRHKETEGNTKKQKELPCSLIGKMNIVKTPITLKKSLQIQHNPDKNTNNIPH